MLNWLKSLWRRIDRWIRGETMPEPYRRSNLRPSYPEWLFTNAGARSRAITVSEYNIGARP